MYHIWLLLLRVRCDQQIQNPLTHMYNICPAYVLRMRPGSNRSQFCDCTVRMKMQCDPRALAWSILSSHVIPSITRSICDCRWSINSTGDSQRISRWWRCTIDRCWRPLPLSERQIPQRWRECVICVCVCVHAFSSTIIVLLK